MSRRVDPASPQIALRDLRRDLRKIERQPGQHIYVGTSGPNISDESPPFQNGWANAGGDFENVSFTVDKHRRVYIRGAADGGDVGSVIFTLPVDYRPNKSERFACAGVDGPTIIQVDPNGDVTQVA